MSEKRNTAAMYVASSTYSCSSNKIVVLIFFVGIS